MTTTSCTEIDLSKVRSIQAYKVGKWSSIQGIAPAEVEQLAAHVSTLPSDPVRIPFNSGTLKCSTKQDISVACRIHTVNISWEQKIHSTDQTELISVLASTPHEFLLTYLGGQQKLIRTTPEGYQLTWNDDNGTCTISLTLTNSSGLTVLTSG